MSEIELGLSYSNLFNYIDSLSLTELRLVECLQIQPLLTHLIQSFNSNGSNLKRLDIVESSRTVVPHVPVSPTISTLLSSFKGLRHLAVATRGSTQVSKESIINHAETLERLQIDNSSNSLRPAAYGESDLAAILTACSNLEELAIEMGIPVMEDWLGIHHDIFQEQSNDLTGEDEASPCSALLPMIASHSRLHTLRMLDHPFIDWDHDGNSTRFLTDPIHGTRRELAAIIVKGVATQVFCHLSKKGSRIQTLAWCPGYYTNIRPTLDSNGHAWLGYMYRKQTTFDLQGKQYVDAAPLRKWWEEIAEDSIFEFVHWISD
ncbi:hypothetical protein NX059_001401 [Plenodomus lindquistii]|nr:hypothetical protein NX059_001401 [Plenodomus lindquistii]